MKINTEFSKYKSIHDDALSKLLSHACATVPYYKKYCGKAFDEFPIVSKADYKEDIDAFVSEQFKKEKLFKSSTSRSTGTPFVVFQDTMKRVRVHSELIAFNALVGYLRKAVNTFKDAKGMFRNDWYKPLLEAAVGIGLAIGLSYVWGTFGVVMGYTLATICIAVPVENWVLFKQGIHKPLTRQAFTLIVTTLFAFAMGAVAYFVGTFIPAGTGWSGVGWFVLRFVFVVVFAAGVFILATCRTEEFKYYKNLAMTIIKKIVGKIKVKLGKKQPAEVFPAIDANEQSVEQNVSDENGSEEGVEQEKEDAENCDSEKVENAQSAENGKQNDGGGDGE